MNKREKTLQHLQLEAGLNRLPSDHPRYTEIHETFLKQSAGYFGETTLDFYLQYLPDHYQVIRDIRLFDGIHYCQLDAIVLCPEFILILEVKNFKGELCFDLEWNQLFRTHNEQKDIFPDPFLQVEHQKRQLHRWLERVHFPPIPIHSFIVISNPHTIISVKGSDDDHLRRKIVRAKSLLPRIEALGEQFSLSSCSPEQVHSLTQLLNTENLPYQTSIMDRYSLSLNDLIKGVQCEQCNSFPMQRKRGYWYCSKCAARSRNAHIKTLRDYQLLIDTSISNKNFRHFAMLPSKKAARLLLLKICDHHTGVTNDRKYVLDLI
ncbi:nuclease-related domain-containing protein [Halobacillus hunanensis]|uniref:nuclease-related domain-containing protein n=1 Tax=Halobacillus hunanensis TaxID=578214 RepID=UPI0009A6EADA|nr:nuclease-related domain-containing protein [Halobacillus hunanensis]